ncbi:MAG: hypothetical protein IKA80_02290 [Spirochaetaceae bacterium]|nr:hypothetical protein [Spirochaetaceae bacterium]MBR2361453.1 hypothetical protein [Spirochaetaceae bacterium]
MTLEEAISDVITNNFSAGDLFDSHAVINELITVDKYHIVYLKGCPENCSVSQYHGLIARKIGASGCVASSGKKIKSHTIYGSLSDNELWERL